MVLRPTWRACASARDATRVAAALDELAAAAARPREPARRRSSPAVEAYATLGEICAVLERAFGPYRAPDLLR